MASERQIETLINKGGGVAAARPARSSGARKTGKVLLRMPDDLLSRVDDAIGAKPLPTTRHAWLLECRVREAAARIKLISVRYQFRGPRVEAA